MLHIIAYGDSYDSLLLLQNVFLLVNPRQFTCPNRPNRLNRPNHQNPVRNLRKQGIPIGHYLTKKGLKELLEPWIKCQKRFKSKIKRRRFKTTS